MNMERQEMINKIMKIMPYLDEEKVNNYDDEHVKKLYDELCDIYGDDIGIFNDDEQDDKTEDDSMLFNE